MSFFRVLSVGVLSIVCAAPPVHAQVISIGGLLQGPQGSPIEVTGEFDARLVYYESEEITESLAEANGRIGVSRGVFSGFIQYPAVLSSYSEVWYELAIDTDDDGIDPEDFFDTRFRITVAPSALSVMPYKVLDTHGGLVSNSLSYVTSNRLHLSLCMAPPAAVQFDQVVLDIWGWGSINNVGIYDIGGNLVCQTGPFFKPELTPQRVVLPVEGTLPPYAQYFVGFTSTGNPGGGETRIRTAVGGQWPHQDFGSNLITTTNGEIPAQIEPTSLGMSYPVNLTLIKSQEESARRSASSLVQTDEGIPIVFPPGYEESVSPEEYQKAVDEAKAAVKALLKKDD